MCISVDILTARNNGIEGTKQDQASTALSWGVNGTPRIDVEHQQHDGRMRQMLSRMENIQIDAVQLYCDTPGVYPLEKASGLPAKMSAFFLVLTIK